MASETGSLTASIHCDIGGFIRSRRLDAKFCKLRAPVFAGRRDEVFMASQAAILSLLGAGFSCYENGNTLSLFVRA
jgi:hypothetical protein